MSQHQPLLPDVSEKLQLEQQKHQETSRKLQREREEHQETVRAMRRLEQQHAASQAALARERAETTRLRSTLSARDALVARLEATVTQLAHAVATWKSAWGESERLRERNAVLGFFGTFLGLGVGAAAGSNRR
jgi:predicted nuclease with TOPRIM domain